MIIGFKQLVGEANEAVTTRTPEEVLKIHAEGSAVLVDVRDGPELERDGQIPGAVHASRGMLEFYVDPESPYHKEVFAEDKEFIFY